MVCRLKVSKLFAIAQEREEVSKNRRLLADWTQPDFGSHRWPPELWEHGLASLVHRYYLSSPMNAGPFYLVKQLLQAIKHCQWQRGTCRPEMYVDLHVAWHERDLTDVHLAPLDPHCVGTSKWLLYWQPTTSTLCHTVLSMSKPTTSFMPGPQSKLYVVQKCDPRNFSLLTCKRHSSPDLNPQPRAHVTKMVKHHTTVASVVLLICLVVAETLFFGLPWSHYDLFQVQAWLEPSRAGHC